MTCITIDIGDFGNVGLFMELYQEYPQYAYEERLGIDPRAYGEFCVMEAPRFAAMTTNV